MSPNSIKFVSILLILCFSNIIFAQAVSLVGPQKYRIARDNALGGDSDAGDLILLISINIWGEVGRPGVYEVPDKTDLISALSLTGGPTASSKIDEIKIVRGEGENKEVIVFNAKKDKIMPDFTSSAFYIIGIAIFINQLNTFKIIF